MGVEPDGFVDGFWAGGFDEEVGVVEGVGEDFLTEFEGEGEHVCWEACGCIVLSAMLEARVEGSCGEC